MPAPDPHAPTLMTDRLVLRAPGVADAQALCTYFVRNDARFAPWRESRSHDVREHAAWLEARAQSSAGSDVVFVARAKGSDDVVAVVTLSGFSLDAIPEAMLAYSIDAAYEGRGLASEAVRGVIEYARDALRLGALSAYYDLGNERSARLLQRLGFTELGATPVIPGYEKFMRAQMVTRLVLA